MGMTKVTIDGEDFLINGTRTYAGREYEGRRVEGLLMNSRMVQATFDDLNPETRGRWAYPDGDWDPDRNTSEFIAMLPVYRDHGLIAFTVNLQGGSPEGYSKDQPWENTAFDEHGGLRPAYMARLERILAQADQLGMVVIVGLFYFGQDERLRDESAVIAAVDAATDWLVSSGHENAIVEIANEINVPRYDHEIITPARCHELIERVRTRSGGKLLVGTSMGGGAIPPENVVEASDLLLVHGNGVKEPDRIREMVDECRAVSTYRGQPIVFNEDDHFDFDEPDNNMLAAIDRHAGWGYFDYRMKGEGYDEGYQSVPVNWGISSERKRGFFELLKQVTGA
ncbi:MAG: hypothetical protein ACOC7V_07865 [Spirochaetota bacterium]